MQQRVLFWPKCCGSAQGGKWVQKVIEAFRGKDSGYGRTSLLPRDHRRAALANDLVFRLARNLVVKGTNEDKGAFVGDRKNSILMMMLGRFGTLSRPFCGTQSP
jgi:hypothetical protein